MKKICVISGKGGTGKTTLTAAFALLAGKTLICDCDVDTPNLHLILNPDIKHSEPFYGKMIPVYSQESCTACNICLELCRFGAITEEQGNYKFNLMDCEGCGVCATFCPAQAITMQPDLTAQWHISLTRAGIMVHARLGIAQEGSGKLITILKKAAEALAEKTDMPLLLIDAPAGMGCSVIAALTNCDMAVAVTEPTCSGIHDLMRISELCRHFHIETKIIINKFDINLNKSREIEAFSRTNGIEVLGKPPYDPIFSQALHQGKSIMEMPAETITGLIKAIWEKIHQGDD
jgi:MinD superfamily P-loop ATPase